MSIAELDLSLRYATSETVLVDLRFRSPDGHDDTTLANGVRVSLDMAALLAIAHDAGSYGRALTEQLFADQRLRDAWNIVIGISHGRSAPLRLRLRLDSEPASLHVLRWETLYDPTSARPLCLGQHVLFSRYVHGGDPNIVPPPPRKSLEALVAMASPTDLDRFGLTAFDVPSQLQMVAQALGSVRLTKLAGSAGHGPASMENLWQALNQGVPIVYLACHSRLIDGKPRLWLEDSSLKSQIIAGEAIADRIAGLPPAKRPSLIVLAACHSAGNDDPNAVAGALGPMLVRAGVRAVIGMQGLAPIAMVERLIPEFFRHLLADGLVDQALAVARANLPEHLALPWWMPVLFMRATDGRVWAIDEPDGPQLPFQQPRTPETYVSRPAVEDQLIAALTGSQAPPVTILYGMSGIGKSSLAARVAQRLEADGSFAGVLWGSLDHLTPNDQLLQFLGVLGHAPSDRLLAKDLPLRDLFWKHLAELGKPLLVVCDQATSARQLAELLPSDPLRLGKCRMLVLGVRRLKIPGLDSAIVHYELGGLTPNEAHLVFEQLSSKAWVEQHRLVLTEISRSLEYVPQLLTLAARDMVSGAISPPSFLQRIAEGRRGHQLLDGSVTAALEVAIRELSNEQRTLLEFIGVLGEGDWNYRMLAAVARRAPEAVRLDLMALVERDLVRRVGAHRFRANTLVREFALERISRPSPYILIAATTLFARHCLDLAQDAFMQANRLQAVSTWIDKGVVEAFRDRLRPELSHLRRALHWASEQEAWELLLRFAYVPALELLTHLVANRYEIQLSLTMPTIIEPVTRSSERAPSITSATLITSADWLLTTSGDPQVVTSSEAYTSNGLQGRGLSRALGRCELIWNITAGHIVDGVLTETSLVDSIWKGVRAPRLICRKVDIVGSQLLACDLSQSVLFDCDARQVQLLGTILQDSLLVEVRLHGADLRSINANGAIFEQVDLRGADLRDASFVGARLDGVDLRGADLRGADFSGAELSNVELHGCKLQSVTWTGASLNTQTIDDIAQRRIIEAALGERSKPPERPNRPAKLEYDPEDGKITLVEQDVRARRLNEYNFADVRAARADFSAADFTQAHMEGMSAEGASGRGALLRGAELARAQLVGADLRAADLERADLSGANLDRAKLRSALAWHALIPAASLRGADLRYADLANADLRKSDLSTADLRGANLTDALLTGATLRGANLAGADLRGAHLHDADLHDACGSHTNLQGALLDDLQLAMCGALGGATLPDGSVVPLLSETYVEETPKQAETRFAQWSGVFTNCDLRGLTMFGARLDGRFWAGRLDGAMLEYAQLHGIFAGCSLTRARLVHARLSGIFHMVVFTGANMAGVSLQGASLVNCRMEDVEFTEEQLKAAARLRGTHLSFGRYDGRFRLAGDLEDARKAGLDPDDHEVMRAQFYDLDEIRIRP